MRSHHALTLAGLALCSSLVLGQQGPDVIVGDFPDIDNYGMSGGISAFAFGTSSCNVGNTPLSWLANNNLHPVIGQGVYRIKDGKFEQIGISWLKHGFYALSQTLCGGCPNGDPTGNSLAVGCSDPYVAQLNGAQSSLGPRSDVNPVTGYFPYPPTNTFPQPAVMIGRRLQINNNDINPTLNAGARYFVEGQYVHPEDSFNGNQNNNASYHEIAFTQTSASLYTASFVGATHQQQPAIYAWPLVDPTVQIVNIDIPGDGRFVLAHKAISLGDGTFQYVWALHNLNSYRGAQAFTVQLSPGANVTSTAYHDVNYHSGETFSTADWTPTVSGNTLTWSTATYAANPHAAVLQWGQTATYTAVMNKMVGPAAITLFRPGTPAQVSVPAFCPPRQPLPSTPPPAYTAVANGPLVTVAVPPNASVGPIGDDAQLTVNLGFTFPFYGGSYTQVVISTNGYVTFPGENGTVSANTPIPNAAAPNNDIAVYADDLINANSANSNIKYFQDLVGSTHRFVVHYNNIPLYANPSQAVTCQLILAETGQITSSIISTTANGTSATRGIEGPNGTAGIQTSYNLAGSVAGGTTVVYSPTQAPLDAALSAFGDLSGNTVTTFSAVGPSNGLPVVIAVDTNAGPTSVLGGLRSIQLGFTPNFLWVFDATGILTGGPYLPTAVTGGLCNKFDLPVYVPPGVLPTGLNLYFVTALIDPTGPGGVRISAAQAIQP